MSRAASAALLTVLLLPAPTAAQSLTSLRGLGYPLVAADARSEALGNLGIGLLGLAGSQTSPASAAGVDRRGVVFSAMSTERRSTLGEASARTGTTRFPLMRIYFPLGPVVLTGGYGGVLDQSWAVSRQGTQEVGGVPVRYQDVVESVGGIGRAQVGLAVPLGERFAVGVTAGWHTGLQQVSLRRVFTDTTAAGTIQAYRESREADYSGPTAQVGMRWDPVDALRVGVSVSWSGTVSMDSVAGPVTAREFDMPMQVAAGASAYLAPGLLAAVSGRWTGWSVTDASAGLSASDAAVESRDTWELGVGLELDDPERRTLRSFPLRLGFEYRQLPFTFVSDAPTEWVASAGTGMRIGTDVNTPLARIDFTVQRGSRGAAGDGTTPDLDESMWRFVLGVSIFGT